MERNKIAIVNSVFKNGSTGRICFELQNYLNKYGYECNTFYGRNNVNEEGSIYIGLKIDFFAHVLLSRFFGSQGLRSKFITKRLIRELKKYKPDLFILSNLHGYYLNYEMLLKYIYSCNVPVIMILHDCWTFTGHCAHFMFYKCDKWRKCCYACKFLKSYPKTLLFDNTRKNYLKKKELFAKIVNLQIVCPSKWMEEMVSKSFLNSKKTTIINNGININIFKKKEDPVFKKVNHLEKYKLILCVAYIFDEKKGLFDIIKLSGIIPNNYRIVLVGKIRFGIRLPNNVIHVIQTNNVDDLVDIYSSCEVFFNPTYEDTYSNVNMEALSCGLPVICYKSGGAYEMIDQRYVIEQGDLNSFSHLLEKAEYDYDFGDITNFSKDIAFGKYRALIEKSLKNN